jgi:hypothetical protein
MEHRGCGMGYGAQPWAIQLCQVKGISWQERWPCSRSFAGDDLCAGAGLLPQLETVRMPGLNHLLCMREPQPVAQTLAQFFAKHSPTQV